MTWATDPATWVVGAVLTAAQLNTELRERMKYLKGTDGEIVFVDYPDFPSTAQGDIFYHNGTKLARLAAGTANSLLKTQGAGANPIWAAGIINQAAGITPVATGWDTDPTTLTNLTDGDLTTATGEGSYVKADAGEEDNMAEVMVDLGAVKPIARVAVKFGIRTTDGSYTCSALARAGITDGAGEEVVGLVASTTSTTEVVYQRFLSPSAFIRYIGIRGYNGTANKTVKLIIYEVIATSAW